MQLNSLGLLEEFCIAPPRDAQFDTKVQLVRLGLPVELRIPPPYDAEFAVKVQLVRIGLLPALYIPPPYTTVELPMNLQFVSVGLLELQ